MKNCCPVFLNLPLQNGNVEYRDCRSQLLRSSPFCSFALFYFEGSWGGMTSPKSSVPDKGQNNFITDLDRSSLFILLRRHLLSHHSWCRSSWKFELAFEDPLDPYWPTSLILLWQLLVLLQFDLYPWCKVLLSLRLISLWSLVQFEPFQDALVTIICSSTIQLLIFSLALLSWS